MPSFLSTYLIDELMISYDGRYVIPEPPTFIVVEAKRTRALEDSSSEAELFGQMKSVCIRE